MSLGLAIYERGGQAKHAYTPPVQAVIFGCDFWYSSLCGVAKKEYTMFYGFNVIIVGEAS